MKILVTGANGQLGNEMREILKNENFNVFFTDLTELNICDEENVKKNLREFAPEIIVNCAAHTAVDKAEEDFENCDKLNHKALEILGKEANALNIKILHISTDYVFDGENFRPYLETDPTNPRTVYGKTKLDGERALQKFCPESIIIRTAWLYSSFGNNFVKTMLKLGAEREKIAVIADQIGTPTYARDLAKAILQIIKSGNFQRGIYHFSNEGVCSWYDFAHAIFKFSNLNCAVNPIESKDYAQKTPRPHFSVLNKRKIKETFKIEIPHWEESLQECLKKLNF